MITDTAPIRLVNGWEFWPLSARRRHLPGRLARSASRPTEPISAAVAKRSFGGRSGILNWCTTQARARRSLDVNKQRTYIPRSRAAVPPERKIGRASCRGRVEVEVMEGVTAWGG